MANRKAAQEFILKYIHALLPDGQNRKLYEDFFATLSDEDFGKLMDDLASGKEILKLRVPNGNPMKLSVERNLAIAKELGHEFFQHLELTDPSTGVTFRTPKKYLILLLMFRRQAQTLQNKISIPEDTSHTDQLTDQPTGPSKGSKISLPELQILYAQGLDKAITEVIKYRGGDRKGFNAMNRLIYREGAVNQEVLAKINTRVKATDTLKSYLEAMHLTNNL
jgi:hypothetical protein